MNSPDTPSETEPVRRSAGWTRAALALCLIAAFAFSLVADSNAGSGSNARSKATDHDSAERLETVPIGRDAYDYGRSVMSLGIGSLGALREGDLVRAGGEVQISVCLKPNSNHPGPGHDCIGKVYGYNPTIKAKLVLAPKESSNGGGSTTQISEEVKVKCHQKQPGRNHHCVLGVPVGNYEVGPDLPCNPSDCKVNMIVSAHHNDANARGRHKVVVGSLKSNGSIDQGQGKINVVRVPDGTDPPRFHEQTERRSKGVPIVAKTNNNLKEKVVMSLRLPDLRGGEQLIIEARTRSTIGHLNYNVLNRTRMVLADKPTSTSHAGSLARKVAGSTTKLSASNGYNCTQAPSGYRKTCQNVKTGVLDVRNSTGKPLFVNLIGGQRAQLFYHRWRSGDSARVPRKGAYIRAWRYNQR